MKLSVILQLFITGLSSPFRLLKKLSYNKFIILLKALKNEPTELIIYNFKRFLFTDGNTNNKPKETSFYSDQLKAFYLKTRHQNFLKFIKRKIHLEFNKTDKPILTIAIVLYNKVGLSLACLKSINETVKVNYQLIIIDNNSNDETPLLLANIKGADIIRNSENLHFNKANNQALEIAKGEYFLLLNNDTVLKPDTLKNALNTFDIYHNCGAVGAKLIYPNGKLQEAGSIIWNDASCLGYGRNDDPNLPQYNFLREVDYCSGAFLLTKTALFKKHGGFDTQFEPAYYEETDYCLWLNTQGYKVIYNPKIELTHFEFGSGLSDWAIKLQQTNQQKFYTKHNKTLVKHRAPDFSNLLSARFAASDPCTQNILYIDDRVPHRDFGSGFPRSNTIVKIIQELGYRITIYPLNFPDEDTWDVAYRDIDPHIEIVKGYGLNCFEEFIKERERYYQVIWVSRPHNMGAVVKYLAPLKDKLKIVCDAEAIFAQREIALSRLKGEKIDELVTKQSIIKELDFSNIAHVVSAVSAMDAKCFTDYGKANVEVLGHLLEPTNKKIQFDERENLLFVGNLDYNLSPNTDSLLWFINEVFPIIQKQIQGIKLNVVGSSNAPILKKIKNKAVKIHGRIDNIEYFYNQSKVFIAPTRYAAGIPFKIHEAAANGIPVVATKILCDQLGWINNDIILKSEIKAEEFALNVVNLYNHRNLWEQLQSNALDHIKAEMSFEAYKNTIKRILL
ncbi:MAG TPA: glycosyltransferase [Prolixibacteraceae bacterium]|nr:glycosyltransferase [Prolixibacteraceae bacterium]